MPNLPDEKHQSLDFLMQLANGWKDFRNQNAMRRLLIAAEYSTMLPLKQPPKLEKIVKEKCEA